MTRTDVRSLKHRGTNCCEDDDLLSRTEDRNPALHAMNSVMRVMHQDTSSVLMLKDMEAQREQLVSRLSTENTSVALSRLLGITRLGSSSSTIRRIYCHCRGR